MVNVLFAEGFEEVEALTVVDMLRRAEIEVNMISADGKQSVKGAHGIEVIMDADISGVKDGEMIFLPGGIPGVPNLAGNRKVVALINEYYNSDKYIAAICAAPSILGALGMLDGKEATCYPSFSNKLGNGKYTDTEVTVDGKIITSKAAGTAMEFSFKLIEILKNKEIADKVKNSVYYRWFYEKK